MARRRKPEGDERLGRDRDGAQRLGAMFLHQLPLDAHSRHGQVREDALGFLGEHPAVAFDVPQPAQRLQDRRLARPHAHAQAPDPVDLARGLGLGGPWPHDHAEGEEDKASDHEALHRSPLRVSQRESVTSYMGVSVEWGHRGVNATGALGVRLRLCQRRLRHRGHRMVEKTPVFCPYATGSPCSGNPHHSGQPALGAALLEHYVCVISPVEDESLSPDLAQVMYESVRWPWRSGLHGAA